MAGSRAASAREPGQIREEAALSDTARAPRASLAGAEDRRARPRARSRDRCTVRLPLRKHGAVPRAHRCFSPMPEDALDIVRRSAERWNAGDFEGMFDL